MMNITDDNRRNENDRLNIVQCRDWIYECLIRNGDIDSLKDHFSDVLRLSGWNRLIRDTCIEYIKGEGTENVNISHMLCDMIPFGREHVPPDIRESMKTLILAIAQAYFNIDNSMSPQLESEPSDTYLPLEYQSRDTIPDYGDQSVFAQIPDSCTSPKAFVSSPNGSPTPCTDTALFTESIRTSSTTNSPVNLVRELGGIVLLDRVDREKEKEKEKLEKEKAEQREKEIKDKERQERERIRQELERERVDRLEREKERQEQKEREQKERERQEQKDRERQEQKDRRERHNLHQSLSVPSSPSTPRPDKKSNITESAMMMKLSQMKQPPSLASTLITATAAIAGKKSKHINLNSDNDDDDEDDEELMDI